MVVFLDIKGAYYNVDPLLLYKEMWKLGVPNIISEYILNMIKKKQITAYSDGENIGTRIVYKGLPQKII